MISLRSIRARRDQGETNLVADFDELIKSQPAFRLQGKIYRLKQLQTETFFVILNAWHVLESRIKSNTVNPKECIETFQSLFVEAIEDFNPKVVEDMTVAQCSALCQLIFEHLQGKAELGKFAISGGQSGASVPVEGVKKK